MILVMAGTHEQSFDRLVRAVDEWNTARKEEVLIQTGYSTYEPKHCRHRRFIPYDEITELIAEADIVITHGGPSSFMDVLRAGKVPVVVPRKQEHGEHVNDHQTAFSKEIEKMYASIIVVDDVDKLDKVLDDYKILANERKANMKWNNEQFVAGFSELVSRFERIS